MGQIISASLNSLVEYEDCNPNLTNTNGFFQNLDLSNLIQYPSQTMTYIFVLILWLVMSIIIFIGRYNIGTEISISLILLPVLGFLFGVCMDTLGSWKAAFYGKAKWLKNAVWQKKTQDDIQDIAKNWKGKWGFLGALNVYTIYALYLCLKYVALSRPLWALN